MRLINELLNFSIKPLPITWGCALITIFIGIAVLTGWLFDIASLKSVVPGFVAMKVNTAIGFILAGGSLFLLAPEALSRQRFSIGILFALLVTLIGLLTLGQEIFGWNLGIDELVFKDTIVNQVFTTTPGRMAVSSMIAFTLTGMALMLIRWKAHYSLVASELLVILIITLCAISAVEYAFGRGIVLPIFDNTRMALHTVGAFFLLSIGLLAAPQSRPGVIDEFKSQMTGMLERRVYLALTLCLISLYLTGGAAYFAVKDSTRRADLVENSHEVRRQLSILLSTHLNMERGVRGYLLTGKPDFLKPYEESRKIVEAVFKRLSFLVQNNPELTDQLWQMHAIHQQQINWTDHVIESKHGKNLSRPEEIISLEKNKYLLDLLNDDIQKLDTEVKKILFSQSIEEEESKFRLNAIIFFSILLSLFVLMFTSLVIHRDFKLRHIAEKKVKEQKDLLENLANEKTIQLRDTTAQMQIAFDTMTDGIVVSDVDGKLLYFNPAAIEMHNFSSPEEYMQNYSGLTKIFILTTLNGEPCPVENWPLVRVLKGETLKDLEMIIKRSDKENWQCMLSYSGSLAYDNEDKPLMAVLTIRDITDRYQKRVAEKERDMAEAANKTKSQFLANMSHELRTPLNAIIGYSELLVEDEAINHDEQTVADLEKIQGAGRHLLNLINDILDLSKIEANKIELVLDWFSVSAMIQDIVALIEPLVSRNNNILRVNCKIAVRNRMYSDPTRIRQVLFNLLSNSAKFTSNGQIEIVADKQGSGNILFTVRDTGIGMSEKQLERIFDPFVQADASINKKFGGTGLGLTISDRIAKLLGGELSVESTPGKGTTFKLSLPLTLAENYNPDEQTQKVNTLLPVEKSADDHATVLIIDDDPKAQDLLKKYLKNSGWNTVTASNTEEGIKLARGLKPNAITLDVIMTEGLDGWAALEILKADPETSSIPVIMCSILHESNRGFALGANEYLIKPIKREKLLVILNKFKQKSPGNLLVIDDDENIRDMLSRTATPLGWKVAEAIDGKDGLEQISRQQPDLILLDLMMPELDGFKVITALQEKPEWKKIPVIVITGKDLTIKEREQLNGYVEKVIEKNQYDFDKIFEELSASLSKFRKREN